MPFLPPNQQRQSTEGKSNCCRHTKNKNKDNTVENDAMMYNDVDNTLKLSTESPRANFELLEIYRGEMLLVINITWLICYADKQLDQVRQTYAQNLKSTQIRQQVQWCDPMILSLYFESITTSHTHMAIHLALVDICMLQTNILSMSIKQF